MAFLLSLHTLTLTNKMSYIRRLINVTRMCTLWRRKSGRLF